MDNTLKSSWELTTITIVSVFTIALFIFLVYNTAYIYLAALFLLFGSIIISSLNIYINKKNAAEKEARKEFKIMKRVLSIVRSTIKQNSKIASYYSTKALSIQSFNQLNSGFWDIISVNAPILEIEGEELSEIMDIKMITDEINGLILTRNEMVGPLANDAAPGLSRSRSGIPLSSISYDLRKKLDILVEKSDEYLSKHQ